MSVDRVQNLKFSDLLHKALTGASLLGPKKLSVPILMRQIVSGRRLFHAARASGSENLLAVGPIEFLHDQASRTIWLQLRVSSGDMVRLGIGHAKLLQLTNLKSAFRSVRTEANQKDEVLLELLDFIGCS